MQEIIEIKLNNFKKFINDTMPNHYVKLDDLDFKVIFAFLANCQGYKLQKYDKE